MRRPASARATFDTRISGIPCQIDARITYGYPASEWEPEGRDEVEVIVLDRHGRPAPWIARKLTQADINRIKTEAVEADYARLQIDKEP